MRARTAELWDLQNRHPGDRARLFRAVAATVDPTVDAAAVLYPGSFVDLAASFVFRDVTYVDVDRRAARFFADEVGVREIVAAEPGAPADPRIEFVHADYTSDLGDDTTDHADDTTDLRMTGRSFDLLVSLYTGPVSRYCGHLLRLGGTLLAHPSHGDVALASIDGRFELCAVVTARSGEYSVSCDELDTYLVPKRPVELDPDEIERSGRGVAYTRSPFAYMFTRVR